MNAIDNSNLTGYCRNGCDITKFFPKVNFTYDAAAKTIDVTDSSTLPAGETLKIVHVKVHDQFGNEVRGEITVTGAPGKKTVDVSTLTASKGLNLAATVITTSMIADGSFFNITQAGDLSNWDKQNN